MEKKVFCLIGERCKSIKYVTRSDLTDSQLICRALKEAAKNDTILKATLGNKSIVLQRPDPDRNNKLCDIDEDDEVPDKCEVTVVLVQTQEETNLPPTTACSAMDILPKECLSIDFNVLYEEMGGGNILGELIPSTSTEDPLVQNKIEGDGGIVPQRGDVTQFDEASTSDVKNEPSISLKKKLLPRPDGAGSIPHPAPLPPLTFDLKQKLEKNSILELQKEFIYFWGTYLWQATLGQPSKQDYQNFATSIVTAYPSLSGGMNGCGIVKTQLSTWIRNHRANEKKKLTKRDHRGKVKSPVKCVLAGTQEISRPTEIDIKNAEKELEKKHKDSNAPHVKRLLEITLQPRRAFIEKEAASMSEVLSKYPQLQEYEMMIFELLTLKKLTMDVLFDNINSMIEKLARFFSVHGTVGTSKALVLTTLCDALTKNKSKSNVPALFTVQEMMGSTENLITSKNDSPRIVLYIVEDEVAAAYLVADQNIRVKIPAPTVEKSIACLMSAYYAWDTAYPKAYVNILEYIDNEVLATTVKLKPAVLKFIRERDNALM